MIKHISSISELDNYLSTQDTENCNFVGYFWHEYGWLPHFFNELFEDFFNKIKGKTIGVCFLGHEIFYEDKVDELIVLNGFTDTSRAYVNNQESDLLKQNFYKIKDKGIAFWNTVKCFDEDKFDEIISKYDFKNTLHSIGRTTTWEYGLYPNATKPYIYASGEIGDLYIPTNCTYGAGGRNNWSWRWDLSKVPEKKFDRLIEDDYDIIFVKNSWKTRKNENVFVGKGDEGTPGFGYLNHKLFINICNEYIKNKRKLVIVDDLVKYEYPDNPYLISFNMKKFFDVKKFINLVSHCNLMIGAATGITDLSLYYCPSTNFILLDDMQKKLSWFEEVTKKYNKKAIAVSCQDYDETEWVRTRNFIKEVL